MTHPKKPSYATDVRHWSSADGTPPPRWVLDSRQEQTDRAALTVSADDLDQATDLPEPLVTIRDAIARLRSDVASTTGPQLDISVYGPDPSEGHYEVGPGRLVTFHPGDDPEVFLVELADEQSLEVSETLAALGRLEEARCWPPCPSHDRSMDPRLVDGVASWVCREDGEARTRIGELVGDGSRHPGVANDQT